MRDLIRRNLAREQFRTVILAGLESGPAVEWTSKHFNGLRAQIARARATVTSSSGAPAERKARANTAKAAGKKSARA